MARKRELIFEDRVAQLKIGEAIVYVIQNPDGLRVSVFEHYKPKLIVNGCSEQQAHKVIDSIEITYNQNNGKTYARTKV